MAAITRLVVYDSVLFNRTGHVRRWADGVERRFTANAIEEAPLNKRTNKSHWDTAYPVGSLKASIRGEVNRIGPVHLETIISVNVPYATYVLEGTGPVIYPVVSEYLLLPWNPGFTPRRHGKSFEGQEEGKPSKLPMVKGQAANNFLARAQEATAHRHPSLRGLTQHAFMSSH